MIAKTAQVKESHETFIKYPKGQDEDGLMAHQLVGEVTAHQGDDAQPT